MYLRSPRLVASFVIVILLTVNLYAVPADFILAHIGEIVKRVCREIEILGALLEKIAYLWYNGTVKTVREN